MKFQALFEAQTNEQKLKALLTPEFFNEHREEILRSIFGRLSGSGIDRVWGDLSMLGTEDEVGFNMEAMHKNLQKAYPDIVFKYAKYETRYEITAKLYEFDPNWHRKAVKDHEPHASLWFFYRDGKYEVSYVASHVKSNARKFDDPSDALKAAKKVVDRAMVDEKKFREDPSTWKK